MKRKLPILLCSLLGFCLVFRYFVPHALSREFETKLNDWIRIISVFAFVIGLGSLVRVHLRRIAMKSEYWRYSLVVFAGLLLMPVAALIDYATTQDPLANLPADSNLSGGDLSDDLRSRLEQQGLKLAPKVRVKSKGSQWRLEEQKLRFRSGLIRPETISSLNNSRISNSLRQLFTENEHSLPDDTKVKVQKKGRQWLLESGSVWYLVKNEDSQEVTVWGSSNAVYDIQKSENGNWVVYPSRQFGYQGQKVQWIFLNVYVPLDATMFSLLAFFIASAAYRSFRARTVDATLLLLAGIILMFANAPLLSNQLWQFMFGKLTFLPDAFPTIVKDWVLQVPGMAARRAIQMGLALGAISQSLRILLGIDRSWMGE